MSDKKRKVGIWFEMDDETNHLLEASAKENMRTKRKEAEFRLHDHLMRFDEKMSRRKEY